MVQACNLGANSGSVGRQEIRFICACAVHETRADAAIATGVQDALKTRKRDGVMLGVTGARKPCRSMDARASGSLQSNKRQAVLNGSLQEERHVSTHSSTVSAQMMCVSGPERPLMR